ncbi:TPA: hypothetical protein N0F65_006671 [Lagenidium giganteum]|uniref:W2 domain-containing protein n=1 Tax=Lagenidium giganteum TaxID=4803 RepID=A0AAV2Z9K2_9STRA|nr:TPA: hypothetical protein N0F65_006671 [Lagenidium giganteum]
MVRAKAQKVSLSTFLGDDTSRYIPEAALPSGPRARDEGDDGYDRGGRGGYGGPRGYDREPSRSEQSDQWRGDRGGDRGGDRFGDRGGFRGRDDFEGGWRGGRDSDGPSRYDRPMRGEREPEERPSHMRLNLAPRGAGASGGLRGSSSPRGGARSDEPLSKFDRAFGSSRGGSRFGDRGSDRFGGDRFGDRGGDRFGRGDRFGDRRDDDRFGSRFGRDYRDARDDRDERTLSAGVKDMNVNDKEERDASPAKTEEQKPREDGVLSKKDLKRKKEKERQAAEEAKRQAAEEQRLKDEAAQKKAAADLDVMKKVLAGGKKGDALVAHAKEVYKSLSERPGGFAVFEAVQAAAEDVAKKSANWAAPAAYGAYLKFAMENADRSEQLWALRAIQVFQHKHGFQEGVMHKTFMALYTLDVIEEEAFLDYKDDMNDLPGRMEANFKLVQWNLWLETPPSDSEEEDDE